MTDLPQPFSYNAPLPSAALNQIMDVLRETKALALAAQPAVTFTRGALGLATNIPTAQSMVSFGDSHTAGYAASTPALCYVSLLGADLGLIPVNYGLAGSQAADQGDIVYPSFSPQVGVPTLATFMIGANDSYWYNVNTYKQAAFLQFHQAIVAWLATPNKIRAQSTSVTYGPLSLYWGNSSKYLGTLAKQADTQNATATFFSFGSTVYIAYTMEDGGTATFDVLVDGVVKGSYTNAPPGGVSIATLLGKAYGSALIRIAGLAETSHTVQVKKTNSIGTLTLDWFSWGSGQNDSKGVQVVVGGIPRGAGQDLVAPVYLNLIKQSVQQLAQDGLPVCYADVPGFVVPSTDIIADTVHGNDSGHRHFRDAFLAAVNSQARGGIWRVAPTVQIPEQIGDTIWRGSSITIGPLAYGSVVAGGDSNVMNSGFSAIGGGRFNNVQGYFCFAAGLSNVLTGSGNVAFGTGGNDRGQSGVDVFSGGNIAASGDAQHSRRVLRGRTTDATVTRLTQDGAAPGALNTVNLPNNGVFLIQFALVARQTGGGSGTVGDTAGFSGSLVLKRTTAAANTTFVVGKRDSNTAQIAIVAGTGFAPAFNDTGAAAWRVTVNADTTNGGLLLSVTGETGKIINWVASILSTEVVG